MRIALGIHFGDTVGLLEVGDPAHCDLVGAYREP
jgi:hypothetical protein